MHTLIHEPYSNISVYIHVYRQYYYHYMHIHSCWCLAGLWRCWMIYLLRAAFWQKFAAATARCLPRPEAQCKEVWCYDGVLMNFCLKSIPPNMSPTKHLKPRKKPNPTRSKKLGVWKKHPTWRSKSPKPCMVSHLDFPSFDITKVSVYTFLFRQMDMGL